MSDIVAEVADVTEFFDEINGLIRLGDALHPDDAAGERDYAIRVIDTMRRLERHVIKAHAAALRVALESETALVPPPQKTVEVRLKLKMREQS